jgi:hypothetical protein
VFDGIDPVAARAALDQVAQLTDHAARLSEAEKSLAAERAAHRTTRLEATVSRAFIAVGGEPNAADYATSLAAAVFHVGDDGALTSDHRDHAGGPLTVERWLAQQQQERPFLFRPSRGGGAASTSSRGPATEAKPSVSRFDPLAVGQNAAAIAAGQMDVTD